MTSTSDPSMAASRPRRRRFRLSERLLDAVAEAVIATDLEGRIVYWNRFAESLYGWPASEALDRDILEVTPTNASRAQAAEILECLKRGESWAGEFLVRRRDGTTFPAMVKNAPILDENGTMVGVVGVSWDVTDRKQVEAALREDAETIETINRIGQSLAAELELEKLVQALTDAATEIAGAQFGAFFYNVVDEQGEAYTLYTLAGAPRQTFAQFPMPRNTALFAPTFTGERVVRLGDITRDPRFGQNPPYHGMPAGHLPVRSYLAVPVVSRSGEVVGGLFFGHSEVDVFTERQERILTAVAAQAAIAIDNARLYQRAREAEAVQQRRAQQAALVADVGVALSEMSALQPMLQRCAEALVRHLDVALARIWCLSDGQALQLQASAGMDTHLDGAHSRAPLGSPQIGRIARERQPQFTNAVVGDPRISEQDWAKREGMVAFAGYPLLVEGRTVGVMAMFARAAMARDVMESLASVADIVAQGIERKRLEEALEVRAEALAEADRRKNEFLAMLGHELRNPLSAVRNAVQLLDQVGSEDEQAVHWRGIVNRQTERLTHLVDDLLDVSRITRGLIELRRQPVELQSVVIHAIEACRPYIDERRHELGVDLPGDPVWLEADPTRLEQIVWNLLANAARYTPPGGRLSVAARREGDVVVLRVSDTGIGIPQDLLPRIFDLFTQGNRVRDQADGGLGIGLTLVKNLVEMHYGTITAASPGPGKGSEFTIRVPALAPSDAARRRPVQGPAVAPSRLLRVLVVDDNRDATESLAQLLALRGHQVEVAYTGLEAIEAAAVHRPEAVLLDIGLPDMSGYEVARRLREHEATAAGTGRIQLVALTGYGQEQDRRRAAAAGFDHHLTKPVDVSVVQELLAKAASEEPPPPANQ